MFYSAFFAYGCLLRRDWSQWLVLCAPIILVPDLVMFVLEISMFAVFHNVSYYAYGGAFIRDGWIPITVLNLYVFI